MIDRSHIGRAFDAFTVRVEPFQLRLFAKAVGEARPEYVDEAVALAAGYRGLLAPPTFLFSLWLQDPTEFQLARKLGLDLRRVLHGEQSFTIHEPLCGGDVMTLQERIVDIYDKRDGALEFVVSDVTAHDPDGRLLAEGRCTTVVRNTP